MTTYLLDADAVIDRLNGFRPTTAFLEQLVVAGNVLAVNPVVVAEVYAGLAPTEHDRAAQFVDQLLFLPIDRSMAERAGELRYAAARRGVALALTDTLVAATALAQGASVVTGNVRHFRVPGLALTPLPGR